jgi:hypothetical protein
VVLALCLSTSSCSSYKLARLPAADNELPAPGDRIVGPSANVRVTLHDGRVVRGDVVRASSTELVLGRAGNYGINEDVYPSGAIAKIEVESLTEGGQVSTIALLVVTGAVVVAVASLSASGGFGSN